MNLPAFIAEKRDGHAHADDALRTFALGVGSGEIPDYQAAAWLMAVMFRGLSDHETGVLTEAMADSGARLDLSGLPHTVDKHSTGGVGDKTTLVLAPLLAVFGATVAKASGRGLGHTGGTVDKLESIPGFATSLDEDRFLAQAREVGVVVTGQSKAMAPADGVLYALRDATATVGSPPLIAASIMSKKLAGGAKSIVLDVKVGAGAFMKDLEAGRDLARRMQAIGRHAGRNVAVVLSSMEEPLGMAIGNAVEVREAIETLQGRGPADLRMLVVTLAEQVLQASGLDVSAAILEQALDDGSAYQRFEAWVTAQGGRLDDPEAMALAPDTWTLEAPRAGVVSRIDALKVGDAVRTLGGGRTSKGAEIDLGVGVVLHKKVGQSVEAGEPVLTIHHRAGRGLNDAQQLLSHAVEIADAAEPLPLILEIQPAEPSA